ncbi:MAG: hypothetical protein H6620_07330 [Halobacteriovoraceae bacterium]|nr:hypothetical protein [Halobacteriovoraceae bacterium]
MNFIIPFLIFQFSWSNKIEKTKNDVLYKARNSNFITQETFKTALSSRCQLYSKSSLLECLQASSATVKNLDLINIQVEQGLTKTVVFKSELLELLENPKTYAFLDLIQNRIQNYPSLPFNLWEESLIFFQDKQLALKNIAILFQDFLEADTSGHLEYIKSNSTQTKLSKGIFIKLKETLQLMNDKGLTSGEDNQVFYPQSIWASFQPASTPLLYHFYVISYLSYQIKSQAKFSSQLSFALPASFNSIYEILMFYGSIKYLLKDPKTFTHEHGIQDIYTGYLAASFAQETSPMEWEDFKCYAKTDYHQLMEFIFN